MLSKRYPSDEDTRYPEIIFFLGAGASIPAGLSGVVNLVNDFIKWLEKVGKSDHLEITQKILEIIKKSAKIDNNIDRIDIEKLLDIIERLENSDKDLLLDFYVNNNPVLLHTKGYHLISNGNKDLSNEVKKFIKTIFTERKLSIHYLRPLSDFIKLDKPLNIFSTNYDLCIETFCTENRVRRYVDGFSPQWDIHEFSRTDVDVLLYKIHGSVRWYRTEEGDYESSKISFTDTRINLDTGQNAVPLILYPDKKFEYIEPMFDMLGELKSKLDYVKCVFVIGYSFKDDHLARMFRYAAKRNSDLVIFLIGPDAHYIYHNILRRHEDLDFKHDFNHEDFGGGFDTGIPSELEGRVICLPYKIEKIFDSLRNLYNTLLEAQKCEHTKEVEDSNNQNGIPIRWDECLRYYMECEHIQKIKEITSKKMSWYTVMKINYELGSKIILYSFLNTLLWEIENEEWLNRFKEYLPINSRRIRVLLKNENIYLKSEHPSQVIIDGTDAFRLYQELYRIYDNHPIFTNSSDRISKTNDNNGLKINQILNYLKMWITPMKLEEYLEKRLTKYNELASIQASFEEYQSIMSQSLFASLSQTEEAKTRLQTLQHEMLEIINRIEVRELSEMLNS